MAETTRGGNIVTRISGHSQSSTGSIAGGVYAPSPANLKVIGVGGGGGNAVDRMIRHQLEGLDFISVNTDAQALVRSLATKRIRIGEKSTRGLGAGGDPRVGAKAAEENADEIAACLQGADMVFICTGLGGGTGSGAAPIVAEIASSMNVLTVAVVTQPFSFEGSHRAKVAEAGLEDLHRHVDTLISINNDRILDIADEKLPMLEAFRAVDDILRQAIQGISDLVTKPGLINLDFNDVRTVMSKSGTALMAIGHGTGDTRAVAAVKQALESPLLDTSVDGAHGVLLNFTAGSDLSLFEVNEAATLISDAVHPDANIIFGAVVEEKMGNEIFVTVIATRLEGQARTPVRGYGLGGISVDASGSELPDFIRQHRRTAI